MSLDAEVIYRATTDRDLAGLADVYMAAFPASLEHFFGDRPPAPEAVADVLQIPMLSEPQCAFVAEVANQIVGYCLAPAQVGRLKVVARRQLGRFIWRWLGGRYRLGLRAVWGFALDRLPGLRAHGRDPFHVEAHILSIAVHPHWQGRGIGRGLMNAGMAYLGAQHVRAVRLEVRPGNAGAVRLYEEFGFATVGETEDSRGPWLIMIKQMPGDD